MRWLGDSRHYGLGPALATEADGWWAAVRDEHVAEASRIYPIRQAPPLSARAAQVAADERAAALCAERERRAEAATSPEADG